MITAWETKYCGITLTERHKFSCGLKWQVDFVQAWLVIRDLMRVRAYILKTYVTHVIETSLKHILMFLYTQNIQVPQLVC